MGWNTVRSQARAYGRFVRTPFAAKIVGLTLGTSVLSLLLAFTIFQWQDWKGDMRDLTNDQLVVARHMQSALAAGGPAGEGQARLIFQSDEAGGWAAYYPDGGAPIIFRREGVTQRPSAALGVAGEVVIDQISGPEIHLAQIVGGRRVGELVTHGQNQEIVATLKRNLLITLLVSLGATMLAGLLASGLAYSALHPLHVMNQAIEKARRRDSLRAGGDAGTNDQIGRLTGNLEGLLADREVHIEELQAALAAATAARDVAETANQRTAHAMVSVRAALERSEAVERRLGIAIGIADLYVFEADYVQRTFTSIGAETELFDRLYGGDDFWRDAFRSVFPEDLARVRAAWARYLAGEEPYRVEHRAIGPDGRLMWVSATAEIVRDEGGRTRTLVGALRDITDRKRSELELTKALEDAEAGSRAKSQFLTVMSHETRTPLNGVLGMVQVMEHDELTPAQRVRLGVVRQSAEALLVILNNVLDLSELEADDLNLEDGEVDIALVAGAVLSVFERAAAEKGLSLTLDIGPDACGVYAGDARRVGQVLYHLVSNAVKFTDAGSVCVSVERQDGALMIHVADTGVGIAADQQQGVSANFFQGDGSLTRRHDGCGLGLAICRQLTAKMGGGIDFQSRLGHGSKFTAKLRIPRLGAVGDAAANASREEPEQQQPLRILVAEDNAVNQLVLGAVLQQIGVEATIVGDGELAFAAWRDSDWDLILMDIQMPVMDGVSAARAIRAHEASSDRVRTPIIAVTANATPHQVRAYLADGMDDVVTKPIQVARLIEAIERALDASEPSNRPLSSAAV